MSKIYTKRGDQGKSDLFYSTNIDKFSPVFEALGTIDELNSFCGLLSSTYSESSVFLKELPHILFDIGSMIAMEQVTEDDEDYLKKLISRCEVEIDTMNLKLPPLKVFIVPGGSEIVSWSHICRSVARRAERTVWRLDHNYKPIGIFLNRLSDYFFTLSRFINFHENGTEKRWLKREER